MRKTSLWTALVLVGLAAASLALYLVLRPTPLPEQVLYGNGHVEGDEIRIASEIAGRIVESNLVEGKHYMPGTLLLRLDDSDLLLQKRRAEAQVEAQRQTKKRVGREVEIWRHHLKTAQVDLQRYQKLKAQGTIPAQQMEQAENAFEEARGRIEVLEAEAKAAGSLISAAESDRALIVNRIAKTRITAPTEGTVLIKAAEPGEVVQPGQTVAILLDLTGVELKVYIPEKDLAKVTHGAEARVRVDAFPGQYFPARVAQLDQRAQFTPRDIHMPEERVRLVFGVVLALENPDGRLKPGMPADAWILWDDGADWPGRLFVPQ